MTASNVLRTITLATQIMVESNVLAQMHWIASEPASLSRKDVVCSVQQCVLAHRDRGRSREQPQIVVESNVLTQMHWIASESPLSPA